jgi:ankyrin repeat protein
MTKKQTRKCTNIFAAAAFAGMTALSSAAFATQTTNATLNEQFESLIANLDDDLLDAAIFGKLEKATSSLNDGAYVNAKGGQPLMFAASNGHIEIVKLLIDHGADIHAGNNQALIHASSNGRIEVIKLLLDQGADIHAEQDKALMMAVISGEIETVTLLLNNGANPFARNNIAMFLAADEGQDEIITILLERGVSLSEIDLRVAAKQEHLSTVKLILDQGVSPQGILEKSAYSHFSDEVLAIAREYEERAQQAHVPAALALPKP